MEAAKLVEILTTAPEWGDDYGSTNLLCVRAKRMCKKRAEVTERERESTLKHKGRCFPKARYLTLH